MLKSILNSAAAKTVPVDIDAKIEKLLSSNPNDSALAWIIGRQIEGEISSTIFGQFTKELMPPVEGWSYMGGNMQSAVGNTGRAYEVTHGHVFTDEVMRTAKMDNLKVEDSNIFNESLAAQDVPPSLRVTLLYNISGCSLSVINGRYYPCGVEAGATKYRYIELLLHEMQIFHCNVCLFYHLYM